ncbi:serine/threonine-protein kinase [Saccharothrix texasensis]|uniref:non-specific serine/threonine protein kinase n=1 Tax=Saccharothrix texasensis TaxID=103734 RepID=A0A3N1HJ27_9PSEU|nr:serine/threonine-protein kinase [Saccharothrix texasensis]
MVWEYGPYRVESLIARGGMGEVVRAYDTRHDRMVALKLLAARFAEDPEYRERFRREAHAVARLQEPHIIPIHAYGELDGRLYLDMRLVDGQDLAARLRGGGPLDPGEAVGIVEQVAQALGAAHAQNLVHRDVKPSNVLIADAGFAYLVDFGIARALDATTGLTGTGAAIGTLDYMAPERFGDGPTDYRVDVYSLACLLHECLTGSKPFAGTTAASLIGAHLNQPPPSLDALRPGLPPALNAVVARGMAKNPADRFASAAELAAAARAALAGHALPAPLPPVAPRPTSVHAVARPRRTLWLVAAVAVVLATAAVSAAVSLAGRSTPGTATSADGTPAERFTPASAAVTTTSSTPTPSSTTTAAPTTTSPPPVSVPPAVVAPPGADLGLAEPMSVPTCDGAYVTFVGAAVEPGRYRTDVQRLLSDHPGARYLHSPTTGCGSLRHQLDGADIYAVYYGTFGTQDEACAQRAAVGGDAYVKRLDRTTPPSQLLTC